MKIMCLKVPEKLLNGPCGEDCLHQVLIYFWTRWSSSTHGNGEELQELTAVWTHIYIKLSSVFCWNCTFTDFPKYLQCVCVCVKVCVWTNLDLVGPSEAFELPKPHVLRLHPPLPAGRTFLRALPCEHHDQPAGEQRPGLIVSDWTVELKLEETTCFWLAPVHPASHIFTAETSETFALIVIFHLQT